MATNLIASPISVLRTKFTLEPILIASYCPAMTLQILILSLFPSILVPYLRGGFRVERRLFFLRYFTSSSAVVNVRIMIIHFTLSVSERGKTKTSITFSRLKGQTTSDLYRRSFAIFIVKSHHFPITLIV